jgi:hypothetical protein
MEVFFNGQHAYWYQLCPSSRRIVLYSYETNFIQELLKKNEKKLARTFNFYFRYIDDVLSPGPPREIMQGGTRLLWGPGDRLRPLSKLRI